ncbi:soluble calcium-activated nucleotidase 1-like [Amphiura filiformis]|uniref:soluble calcium-activated nucleotidase 1-like n=1 Tax=Amphiura filiformis TaxID=82378 RepID=UPI003B216B2F
MNEWKTNVRTPIHYTSNGGTSVMRFRPKVVAFVVLIVLVLLIILLLPNPKQASGGESRVLFDRGNANIIRGSFTMSSSAYNTTYPMSPVKRTSTGRKYRIGMITDLDTNSKLEDPSHTWVAYMKKGYLTISSSNNIVTVDIDDEEIALQSHLAQGDRAMELSELVCFNGKLYTVDDRTGVVYQVLDDKVLPWVILPDGDGSSTKGFKGEWMAVKDHLMYVGGLGKEWTTITGELVNYFPQWVKLVSHSGALQHLDWVDNYNAMRNTAGFPYPGYMIHESGVWSDVHQSWFFLPRRASTERYDETEDEHRATNLILKCDSSFKNVVVSKIGVVNPIRGFSSFKFVPETNDNVIVALKTEEDRGNIATYFTVFTLDGIILVPDTKFADIKYEGIEFI